MSDHAAQIKFADVHDMLAGDQKTVAVARPSFLPAWLSDLLFLTSSRLFSKRTIVLEQLPVLEPDFASAVLSQRMGKQLRATPNVTLAVLVCFRREFLKIGLCGVVCYALRWYERILLGKVMQFFQVSACRT